MVGDTHLHVFAVKTEDCGGGGACLGHVTLLRRPFWVWFTVWLHQAAQ